MKLLLDENISYLVGKFLIEQGCNCDIVHVRNICKGCPDKEILSIALKEERILVTLDKDFGLLFKSFGGKVVLLRLKDPSPTNIVFFLRKAIDKISKDFQDCNFLAVITEKQMRFIF